MTEKEPDFIVYMREMFAKHGGDWDAIQKKLNEVFPVSRKDSEQMAVFGHFYFYICAPHKMEQRDELRIVGMTSLIEAMMAEVEFKDPFVYFEEELKGKNSIEDFSDFKKKYYEKYGATKKVLKYFEDFVSKEDTMEILEGIKLIDKATSEKSSLKDLEQFAKFLYQMRNDFVHNANMRNFCPEDCFASLLMIGKNIYDVRVPASSILNVFEKSFVTFWQRKYEKFK